MAVIAAREYTVTVLITDFRDAEDDTSPEDARKDIQREVELALQRTPYRPVFAKRTFRPPFQSCYVLDDIDVVLEPERAEEEVL